MVDGAEPTPRRERRPGAGREPRSPGRTGGLRLVLQISRFPWGEDPAGWLRRRAAAEGAGFTASR